MTKPAPGSDAAFAIGCTCPRLDNARGLGAWGTRGESAAFWIADDCPIHAEIVATVEHVWDHETGGPIKIVRPTDG